MDQSTSSGPRADTASTRSKLITRLCDPTGKKTHTGLGTACGCSRDSECCCSCGSLCLASCKLGRQRCWPGQRAASGQVGAYGAQCCHAGRLGPGNRCAAICSGAGPGNPYTHGCHKEKGHWAAGGKMGLGLEFTISFRGSCLQGCIQGSVWTFCMKRLDLL